ncbi:MAG: glycosyltransferase family 2 protein [Microbacteriaceae bacterium]
MTNPSFAPLSVSVALCTHNGERFIEAQLRSILDQTVLPFEIVLSDDDSTDATLATAQCVFDEWVSENPESVVTLRVLHNRPALRVAKNFEQAILACTGDLIALCDQDDVWRPERLAAIGEIFAARPEVLLVHSDARLVDSEGQPLGTNLLSTLRVSQWERDSINSGDALTVLIRRNLVTGATAVIRGECARTAMPVPDGWIHDEWLAVTAAAHGEIVLDDRALIDYRQHENNQIGATSLGLDGKLGRLREPRTSRNARLLVRAASLVDRLERERGTRPGAADLAVGKHQHERFRSALPAARLARILPVLRVAAAGRYRRFGLGAQDVLRDLVQPAL